MNPLIKIKNVIPYILISSLQLTTTSRAADTAGWREIKLAGDTKCADGSPYSIFINEGSTGNLVLDFMGGGACWSAETCKPGLPWQSNNCLS